MIPGPLALIIADEPLGPQQRQRIGFVRTRRCNQHKRLDGSEREKFRLAERRGRLDHNRCIERPVQASF
jgi:hypothetical protein